MIKKYFYLLSYPRSRSTWFSQFFKTNVSYCHHEGLSGNNENAFIQQMRDLTFSHAEHLDIFYMGSADTNPISLGRTKGRISGPMVMIMRPKEDVIKSLNKAFAPHPDFSLEEWEQYIFNMVDMYSIALEWYKAHEPNLLLVDFDELEDDQTLMRIWRHCITLPSYEPDWHYIKNMNSLRITVKRRQGLENGINTTCRYLAKTIEQFKLDHLDNYDRDKFRKDFWREPDPEEVKIVEPPKKREYMGKRFSKQYAQ